MGALPFLDDTKWPISKDPEERVVNPSYDHQLQDHLLDELLLAVENKDHKGLVSSLQALAQSILEEQCD